MVLVLFKSKREKVDKLGRKITGVTIAIVDSEIDWAMYVGPSSLMDVNDVASSGSKLSREEAIPLLHIFRDIVFPNGELKVEIKNYRR